ncbi:MAG: type secretion system-associated lipoprotein [Rhodocyclales bacterium]|nr:type secretion system-associated lipoprotein [Rhodocyclales bacterium]
MKRSLSALRLLGLVLLVACTLAGCAGLFSSPTVAVIAIAADEKLNVDTHGRSTPVVVRYYILKNDSAFNSSDFFSLAEKDQQTLGDALLSREEFTLQPGEKKAFPAKDAGMGQVFAIMVSYRNIDRAIWRATVPLPAKKTSTILVSLKNDQVTLRSDQVKFDEVPLDKLPFSKALPSQDKKK